MTILYSTSFIPEAICKICNHTGATPVFSGPDRLMCLPGVFQFVRCSYCGTFYQWPKLPWDELQKYYQGDYDSYISALADEPSRIRRWLRRRYTLKMRRFVEQFAQNGVLLDIGCGTGVFLEEMQMSGRWQLHGIEPTTTAANYVRQRFGIPVINSLVEQVSLPDCTFDVVTMWNVFEHLSDPKLVIQKVYHSLKPNGIAIIAVPNYESLSRVIFGKYWCGWDLPRHLFILPSTTLLELVKRTGFTVRQHKCFIGTYALLGHSLSFLQQDLTGSKQTALSILQKIYISPIGRLLFYPLQYMTEQTGLASIKVWALQKT
ncbi:class I SAM-dependent methyltransferase [Chloroflexus aggregans]|uniref:Methyltransferase type 11 n=1 Tax=Chloroflexus aggregans (strain MD-66 / DSM 9485) TaxID=326427 RepID=B8GDB6_CHLAD|nr:class I SAM-dependent methyltransferase [Chloroflexus aggregans]ACL25183.1 Methyltransferase type 11 [Chloroflexus aggregans DSM 9485]